MNPSNMLLISDAPPDKVVIDEISGSFSAAARYSAFSPRRTDHSIAFPETFDFDVLPDGVWSMNGTTWMPIGVDIAQVRDGFLNFQNYETNLVARSTDFVITCSNWTGTAQTIYYRVWGYSYD